MEIINKYLEQVDLIDYYITKNITELVKNKNDIEIIKENIFLLEFNNKNNKNSLIILLESKKFDILESLINLNPKILICRTKTEETLLMSMLSYDYFYDTIDNLINNLEYDFIIKLITSKNKNDNNFIDYITQILFLRDYFKTKDENSNEIKKDINKIVKIIKSIYLLDYEKKTLLITKLCKNSNNSKVLSYILLNLDINYFDLMTDDNAYTCIDYLIKNDDLDNLKYLIDKMNYIYFINIDNNLMFEFIKKYQIDDILEIIFMMLKKSNINKLKNNMNRNIFTEILLFYKLEPKYINKIIKYVDIYEQDVDGQTLLNLIKTKYTIEEQETIKIEKNNFKYPNINLKSILVRSDYGLFNSNIIHNMIYTLIILKKYNFTIIPNKILELEDKKQINFYLETSNNEKNILGYLKIYYNMFPDFLPYLVLWINKNNYWLDESLIHFIKKNKKKRFIIIKLSIYLLESIESRHANIIIIDNINKVVERFEPYGEINFSNSNDLNNMIENKIAKKINYNFRFVQPFPGFQARSNEFGKYNKSYGDPFGYCLAWCFLYVDIKMQLSKENPIDVINYYIINKFEKDFEDKNNSDNINKYMRFIRYYGRYLDENKNKLIDNYGIERSVIYQNDMSEDNQIKITKIINKELLKLCKK
jgi:hypothetical protein